MRARRFIRGLVAVTAGVGAALGGMTMSVADQNLADVVAGGAAAILVARIESVAEQRRGEDTTTGTTHVHLVRELTPRRWRGADRVAIKFSHFTQPDTRFRTGSLGWNGIEIQPGAFVLVALAADAGARLPSSPPVPVEALAVAPLASAGDPLIGAVERALQIEQAADPALRSRLIAEGLRSPVPFLSGYGHYAAGRLRRLPRPEAIMVERDVLEDQRLPTSTRGAAAITLELELWQGDQPTDPLNKQILESMFRALLTGDAVLGRTVVDAVYRMAYANVPARLGDPAAYRRRLMEGVALPPVAALTGALGAADAHAARTQLVSDLVRGTYDSAPE